MFDLVAQSSKQEGKKEKKPDLSLSLSLHIKTQLNNNNSLSRLARRYIRRGVHLADERPGVSGRADARYEERKEILRGRERDREGERRLVFFSPRKLFFAFFLKTKTNKNRARRVRGGRLHPADSGPGPRGRRSAQGQSSEGFAKSSAGFRADGASRSSRRRDPRAAAAAATAGRRRRRDPGRRRRRKRRFVPLPVVRGRNSNEIRLRN